MVVMLLHVYMTTTLLLLTVRNYEVWDWGFRHSRFLKNWPTASRGEMKNGNLYTHKQMYVTTTRHANARPRTHAHTHRAQ